MYEDHVADLQLPTGSRAKKQKGNPKETQRAKENPKDVAIVVC
jgi:hypothetical protein